MSSGASLGLEVGGVELVIIVEQPHAVRVELMSAVVVFLPLAQ